MEIQDKYKNRYIVKIIPLKMKLNEVEVKDDKLKEVLNLSELYNEMKLVDVVNIYRVLYYYLICIRN